MLRITAALGLLCLTMTALAVDLDAGKQKAASCAGCHGINGMSNNPSWPNLAGQKAPYLQAQLHAFREGSRVSPIMNSMAKTLSDEDIDNLSGYFSSLPPQ